MLRLPPKGWWHRWSRRAQMGRPCPCRLHRARHLRGQLSHRGQGRCPFVVYIQLCISVPWAVPLPVPTYESEHDTASEDTTQLSEVNPGHIAALLGRSCRLDASPACILGPPYASAFVTLRPQPRHPQPGHRAATSPPQAAHGAHLPWQAA